MTNPGWGGAHGNEPTPPQSRCVRHPERPTGLACSRCGRPACPECLQPAAVGQHCVDCVRAGNASVRRARTVAGAPTGAAYGRVTYILMGLNVLAFAVTALQSRSLLDNTANSSLFDAWALFPPAVATGDVERILGSGFLHIGPIHLLVNMFALYIIGRDVEAILGRARYVAVYAVSLLGGSASVMVLEAPISLTAGASGAIFGLLGAQAVILLKLKRSPTPVLVVIGLNIVISISIPGISLWGHVGGLVAGAAATAGILFLPNNTRSSQGRMGWIAVAGVAALAVAVIAVRALDLRSQMGL
ncbi:MAG: rhomboid family intramembrane serine protease [Rhodococcus sp. (in: high G+C Gram-positive bacteria)]|jgi:membrane associated rhomboid family serine protease|uniref:rhomboid family intramembrane serine protease n=1 Tax=Rhodococcus sp. EPR-157 TaxID=1813677 RepID=UPI0007BC007D|nr:rhomboid family intramembrane serine protease [Rhodococcus sp. EPR-157]KZF02744.1 rhomboid family intramembrane serine protease [Rhodococcus sp. EPR-157]